MCIACCSSFSMSKPQYRSQYLVTHPTHTQVKLKAGRIVPALVTTTAVVAGLLTIELIKYTAHVKLEVVKSSFLNLAVPCLAQSEPGPPAVRILSSKVINWLLSLSLSLYSYCFLPPN